MSKKPPDEPDDPDAPAVTDAEPLGAPELSAPKTPGTPSREPKSERPDDEVKIALLDSNRQEIRRGTVPASEAGAFRLLIGGHWWERVGTTEDGIASYKLA